MKPCSYSSPSNVASRGTYGSVTAPHMDSDSGQEDSFFLGAMHSCWKGGHEEYLTIGPYYDACLPTLSTLATQHNYPH